MVLKICLLPIKIFWKRFMNSKKIRRIKPPDSIPLTIILGFNLSPDAFIFNYLFICGYTHRHLAAINTAIRPFGSRKAVAAGIAEVDVLRHSHHLPIQLSGSSYSRCYNELGMQPESTYNIEACAI